MRTKHLFLIVGGLFGFLTILASKTAYGQTNGNKKTANSETIEGHEADREMIRLASSEFSNAFAKGDAKAVAAHWTTQGEYQEESGVLLRGREAIEKAYGDFFKSSPKSRIDFEIHSIHFPGRDIAIEEGTARQSRNGPELPTSSEYSAIHVREDGEWKIAMCREFAVHGDRLHDLDWLLGKWNGSVKEEQTTLEFEKVEGAPYIVGHVTKQNKEEIVATGTFKIGSDPQTGQLRSWHFNNDGSHGQSLWMRDGNRWLMESRNVMADGGGAASLNILARLNDNEIVWRTVERVVGEQPLPDSVPVKLSRVPSAK